MPTRYTLNPERRTPMDRYIGLDAHASSCTVAVIGPSGRKLQSQVIETNAKALINFICTIPKNRRLIFEEGTHSSWLFEVLSPHVQELVVIGIQRSRGPKSDKLDASAWPNSSGSGRSSGRSTRSRASSGNSGTVPKPIRCWSATRCGSRTGSRACSGPGVWRWQARVCSERRSGRRG